MRYFIVGACVALLMASSMTFHCGLAQAKCGKVWVDGHNNRDGKWIPAHWRHKRWVPGHHNAGGKWVPGHFK